MIGSVPGSDTLLTIAEFSLALAGFSAVIIVLSRREGEIDAAAAYTVRFMILNAVGAGFLALFPPLLGAAGLEGPALWRSASLVYLAFVAGIGLPVSIVQARRVPESVEPRLHAVFWCVSIAAHLAHLANAVGFPFPPSLPGFLLGLYLLLSVAGLQFVALTFRLMR